MKYSLEGKLQEHIRIKDAGETARTKPADPPKHCGLGKQDPKGSRPWRLLKQRLLLGSRGDFIGFLTDQEVFAGPKAGLKEKSHIAKRYFTEKLLTNPCTNIMS